MKVLLVSLFLALVCGCGATAHYQQEDKEAPTEKPPTRMKKLSEDEFGRNYYGTLKIYVFHDQNTNREYVVVERGGSIAITPQSK